MFKVSLKAKGCFSTKTEPPTQEIGKLIRNTVREKWSGAIRSIKANGKKTKLKDLVSTIGSNPKLKTNFCETAIKVNLKMA